MGFVDYEVKGFVGIVTINRQEALNALNAQVFDDLMEVFDGIDLDKVRCVVLTGAGKAFVAGADIAAMNAMTPLEVCEFSLKGNLAMRRIETFQIPVIAAVNGFALGGGNELAMSCDIRLASEKAVFGQPETGLGVLPGFGGTQRLPRIVGEGKAKELLFTARNVKADEALAIGLVQAVYPKEELMDQAMKMAETIAAQGPIGVRMAKYAVSIGNQMDIDTAVRFESSLFGKCYGVDQKEAMDAFEQKRPHAPFINR